MASMSQICIPAAGGPFQEAQEMRTCLMNVKERGGGGTQKYLRKSCYHRIKFTVTTFLAAFMWRRHLNSETLATTIHRKPREVSDGTDTQVISQTIDKCRVKMIQRDLYNVKNLPWKRIKKILVKRITSLLTIVRSQNQSIWKQSSSDWESFPICFWSLIQIFFELVIIVAQIH